MADKLLVGLNRFSRDVRAIGESKRRLAGRRAQTWLWQPGKPDKSSRGGVFDRWGDRLRLKGRSRREKRTDLGQRTSLLVGLAKPGGSSWRVMVGRRCS